MTPTLHDRYVFLCESRDGWTLFADPDEAKYWEGVTDPALLALREEGARIWNAEPFDTMEAAEFGGRVYKAMGAP